MWRPLIGLYSRGWSINEHCLSVLAFIADLSPITLGDGSTWPDLNRLFFSLFFPPFMLCWLGIAEISEGIQFPVSLPTSTKLQLLWSWSLQNSSTQLIRTQPHKVNLSIGSHYQYAWL